ncbi:MAG TPA: 2OG-Fe(II) oxygenase [Terriglobia bacterium]|nr:2OG-Fe(II) oxygenase [Terriglobia bacterium]
MGFEVRVIRQQVLAESSKYRECFSRALPFHHVVIDDFLQKDEAEALLRDFPAFATQNALDDLGRVGGKAVIENIADISPFYARFAQWIQSPAFTDAISEITGISALLPDKTMFGGGTHENLNGQELDPHVDFNFDDRTGLHRRLNLLIYLNKEWDEAWGGSIELHSDPRHPDRNEIQSIVPLFNRAVIFETSEYSWHGFPAIHLPQDKLHLSRKSFSIYLYTKERPIEDVVAPHTTFYVQRPLPAHIQAGSPLSAEDFELIRGLISKRDSLIEFYQRLLIEKEQRVRDVMNSKSWRMLRSIRTFGRFFGLK